MKISDIQEGDTIKLTKDQYSFIGNATLINKQIYIRKHLKNGGTDGYVLSESLPLKWDKIEKL